MRAARPCAVFVFCEPHATVLLSVGRLVVLVINITPKSKSA